MKTIVVMAIGLVASVTLLGSCADRGSREEFRRDLQARLEQLDAKIEQLVERVREAKEDARPRLNALVEEAREKRKRAADKLHAVANATDDSWERFKHDAKSAIDDLGETVERGWREIVK